MTTGDEAGIAAYYDDFGRRWAHDTSPLYEEWALGIAHDGRMLARIASLAPRLRQANLLFAAARWAGSPLVPYPEWSTWVNEHWDETVAVAMSRATQTNEPGRCATLLPVLSRIDGPVALLEVGAAAGLCLLPDRYSVVYDTPSGEHDTPSGEHGTPSGEHGTPSGEHDTPSGKRDTPSGERRLDPDAGPTPFALRCRLDDDAAVPTRMPEVVWRRGIDLSPIDPADADAVDWLATLVWPGPDHDRRVERLRGAARIAASDPPLVVRGDLLERVVDVAAESPAEATLVVFHSAVLLYLDAAARSRFADVMAGLSDVIGRRVVWLSNETVGTLPGIDAQVPTDAATDHRFVQTVDGVAVALAGQHGAVYETALFR